MATFKPTTPWASLGVPCHVCNYVVFNHTTDEYCGVCCAPTHVDSLCRECIWEHGNDINQCAMVIPCCGDHRQMVCVQCLDVRSTTQILGVCRNTLRRAGITRHPNAMPLDFGPIPMSLGSDGSEGGESMQWLGGATNQLG